MAKIKRRNYFIDKSFQAKFIFKFCLIVVIASLLLTALLFYFSQDSTTVAIENTRVTVKSTADFMLPVFIQTVAIVFAAAALTVLLLSLFVSHKIAGPLYRIRKEIDALGKGDFSRNFNLRRKDQLKDLATSLNQMCNSLKNRHLGIKSKFSALRDYLQEKEGMIDESQKKTLYELLSNLGKEIDEVTL